MKKRHRASREIAYWWFSRKQGRLLRHLEQWNKEEEEKEEVQQDL